MNHKEELKNELKQDINNLREGLIMEIINLNDEIKDKELELYELMKDNF